MNQSLEGDDARESDTRKRTRSRGGILLKEKHPGKRVRAKEEIMRNESMLFLSKEREKQDCPLYCLPREIWGQMQAKKSVTQESSSQTDKQQKRETSSGTREKNPEERFDQHSSRFSEYRRRFFCLTSFSSLFFFDDHEKDIIHDDLRSFWSESRTESWFRSGVGLQQHQSSEQKETGIKIYFSFNFFERHELRNLRNRILKQLLLGQKSKHTRKDWESNSCPSRLDMSR